MALTIKNKYSIGDVVYLLTDAEQFKRLVLYIVIYSNGLMYGLKVGEEEATEHYEIEISTSKNII